MPNRKWLNQNEKWLNQNQIIGWTKSRMVQPKSLLVEQLVQPKMTLLNQMVLLNQTLLLVEPNRYWLNQTVIGWTKLDWLNQIIAEMVTFWEQMIQLLLRNNGFALEYTFSITVAVSNWCPRRTSVPLPKQYTPTENRCVPLLFFGDPIKINPT